MPRLWKRDQRLDTASDLFWRDGIRATGVDAVIEAAGVARMTQYNHSGSKEEPVVAALVRRTQRFRAWIAGVMERSARTLSDRLLVLFGALRQRFEGKGFDGQAFRGCAVINAAVGYPDAGDAPSRIALERERDLRTYLAGIAREAGAADPGRLAGDLLMLAAGATVTVHIQSGPDAADRARRIADGPVRTSLKTHQQTAERPTRRQTSRCNCSSMRRASFHLAVRSPPSRPPKARTSPPQPTARWTIAVSSLSPARAP